MLSEPTLRARRLLSMMLPEAGMEVLLVGEREGLLAGLVLGKGAGRVTWVEPFVTRTPAAVRLPLIARDGVERVAADCAELPFADLAFDRVASQFALDHVEDPAAALAEWSRVLRPGGVLSLVTGNANFGGLAPRPFPRARRAFRPDELALLVRAAGFRVSSTTTLLPDLKLPALYRGDLSFSSRLEGIPYLKDRGRLLFLSSSKTPAGVAC
jgi:SAM-dependent methyltransferase